MHYLIIAVILTITNSLTAATYNDPISMFEIPELKLNSFLNFTNNYMYRGETMSNDQGAVQGGFHIVYGENVDMFLQGSSVNYGNASMEAKLTPRISNNFGLDWLKLSTMYQHVAYPNYTDATKNYFMAYHRFYYNNFKPYIVLSKQINGNKIQYTEVGLVYKYHDYFVKVLYSKDGSKIKATEASSELNGINTQLSAGYKWKHYTFTLSTNRFNKDAYTGNVKTTTKNTWISLAYQS